MDERLINVLVRVQQGQTLTAALNAEKQYHYYYDGPDDETKRGTKARIKSALREIQQQKKDGAGPGAGHHVAGTAHLDLRLPTGRREQFEVMCQDYGVSMNRRINTLIVADLNAWNSRGGHENKVNGGVGGVL